ncbi:MAG: hypothetical protein KDK39_00560 [Leptospiraceae bacterium]|nr:hypothetical protein [Leptospiraceae bacterium]
MTPRPLQICSTAVASPSQLLRASQLDERLGLMAGESERITGIRQRYQSDTETAAQLAATACQAALQAARLQWADIDCLVAASATMDKALPYNAAMIHAELGLLQHRTMTMDMGASCLSFLSALDIISYAIGAGRFQNVMLVSADISTFTVDYRNLRENGIFGDGGAAVVVRAAPQDSGSAILAANSITISAGVDYCHINAGGTRYHRRVPGSNSEAFFGMNGRAVFALATREMPAFVEQLLADAGCSLDEIDLVVPHQASRLALDHMMERLQISRDKCVDIFAEHGNQVGASLPTALHHGLQNYGIQRGNKIMLLGTGAGLTIGGMILVY